MDTTMGSSKLVEIIITLAVALALSLILANPAFYALKLAVCANKRHFLLLFF